MPKTVAGCWRFEHSVGDATQVYSYELKSDGTGWIYGSETSPLLSEPVQPDSVTWSKDPDSSEVTIPAENRQILLILTNGFLAAPKMPT